MEGQSVERGMRDKKMPAPKGNWHIGDCARMRYYFLAAAAAAPIAARVIFTVTTTTSLGVTSSRPS